MNGMGSMDVKDGINKKKRRKKGELKSVDLGRK